jgi:tripartite-type tricarboxylate transporter receptor subunit TctC
MNMVPRAAAALALIVLAASGQIAAQDYPGKPVRVIVVFPPGGSNDVVARLVFQKVSELLGQQFVIENRGGAAGTIGSEVVAGSTPDGYTLMVQSTTHVANPHLYKKLPYDALRDFVGITTLARQVGMLAVHPSLPAKSVREFIALAKSNPGKINYGSAGNGSFVHLSMALFASMAKIRMVHVPYKGGGPAGNALIAGETQAMMATIGSLFPHIKSGRVRPIGVTSAERTRQFPNVPAVAETVPGYEFTAWVGCFAPAGVPPAIVNLLNATLKQALMDPDVESKLVVQTLDPLYLTPAEFAGRLKADFDKYASVVALSGARVE